MVAEASLRFSSFLFLSIIIPLKILSMVQADSLYERLNKIVESRQSSEFVRVGR